MLPSIVCGFAASMASYAPAAPPMRGDIRANASLFRDKARPVNGVEGATDR